MSINSLISFITFPQRYDFLTIYDGMDNIYNKTGKLAPRNIRSSASNMKIYFTSGDEGKNHKEPSNGFEITVDYIIPGNFGIKWYIYIYIYIYIFCRFEQL